MANKHVLYVQPIFRLRQCKTDNRCYSHLYKRSLKLALDWSVHRYLWRGQALYIRSLFEANRHVTEPRQQRVREIHTKDEDYGTNGVRMKLLIQQTEELLEKWKHPDPYRPPTAPGGRHLSVCSLIIRILIELGSKYERNLPAPILDRKLKLKPPVVPLLTLRQLLHTWFCNCLCLGAMGMERNCIYYEELAS